MIRNYEKPAIAEMTASLGGEVMHSPATAFTPVEWAVIAVAAGTWVIAIAQAEGPSGMVQPLRKQRNRGRHYADAPDSLEAVTLPGHSAA